MPDPHYNVTAIRAASRQARFAPRLAHTTSVIGTVRPYVETGVGVGIIPDSVAAHARQRSQRRFRNLQPRQKAGQIPSARLRCASLMQSSAFQIEPGRRPYPLRLSKYQAIGESVGRFAAQRPEPNGRKLSIADVGGDEGRIYRYIEAFLPEDRFEATIIDLFPKGMDRVYKKDRRSLIQADLEFGLPMVPSLSFDVIICEQVMEHLQRPGQLAAELHRALRPGGLCIMGVPTFPAGFRWVRGNVIPRLDRMRGRNRSHVQAFSVNSFLQMIRRSAPWELTEVRGFRIVSGGLLRNLEYYRWWWRLNRWLGRQFPSLCIEAQALATKPAPAIPGAPSTDTHSNAADLRSSSTPHIHA